jgi:hypothetical protein
MSSLDFSLICSHKSFVDFRLSPETNLKLKAFGRRAGFASNNENFMAIPDTQRHHSLRNRQGAIGKRKQALHRHRVRRGYVYVDVELVEAT